MGTSSWEDLPPEAWSAPPQQVQLCINCTEYICGRGIKLMYTMAGAPGELEALHFQEKELSVMVTMSTRGPVFNQV